MIVSVFNPGSNVLKVSVRTEGNRILFEGVIDILVVDNQLYWLREGDLAFISAQRVLVGAATLKDLLRYTITERDKRELERWFEDAKERRVVWVWGCR